MNYLAHLFLSGSSDEMLVGNLIGDFVKGQVNGQFPGRIGEGIMLHRQIDSYSNDHPQALVSRNRFSRKWRRFAGIILDICYDHFLIRHWHQYTSMSLTHYIDEVHGRLQPFNHTIHGRLPFFPTRENLGYLLETNEDLDGVMFTLSRISNRMKNGTALVDAIDEIESIYSELEGDFSGFFPDLIAYVHSLYPESCPPSLLNLQQVVTE